MKTFAVITLSLFPSYAYADWQNTRWGMTQDEVKAAESGSLTAIRDEKRETAELSTPLLGKYSSDGINFAAYYRFDKLNGGLKQILLEGPPKSCPKVAARLQDVYGQPTSNSSIDRVAVVVSWRDQRRGNKVVFRMFPGICELSYDALPEPGSKGGL